MAEINIYDLPPQVQDWADAIGLSAVTRVIDYYGGTYLYVPTRPGNDHQLVILLGYDTACRFCHAVGNGEHLIPKCQAAMRRLQDQRIAELLQQYPVPEVARRTGLHERTIRRIKSRQPVEKNDQQPGLFE